ncbi:unnamed protein product [Nesidiocoris tenuis]|uniref:peptidylprolyl isomerase n=1 Tax=Nesidiocoris tenuis TaxID=355587 RepID=A0A6H5G6K1_9HEMI|nr:unnamed protein product [Nesidiocoris tenuis]
MNVDAGDDITPKADGGILKKITAEGSGTTKPGNGCKVTVHYTGTLLDGTVFDSSRDRDTPFEFPLGKGKVISGWDIGVATMKLGERAVFTIREDYAYGKAGSPPKIPPKATLVFDVELISWQPENLSGKKDKGILRFPVTNGSGFESPKEMAEVKIQLKGEFEGRVFDEREVTFNLGEGKVHDLPPGLDTALTHFVVDETSELQLAPQYGFGEEGCAKFNIPPNATLKYTVTLKSFEKAYLGLHDPQLAKADFEKIVALDSTNKAAAAQIQIANQKLKEIRSKEKQMYANMFEKFAQKDREWRFGWLEGEKPQVEVVPDDPELLEERKRRREQKKKYLETTARLLKEKREREEKERLEKEKERQEKLARGEIDEGESDSTKVENAGAEEISSDDVDDEKEEEERKKQPDVMKGCFGEWGAEERQREPTNFEKENPDILMLEGAGDFKNMFHQANGSACLKHSSFPAGGLSRRWAGLSAECRFLGPPAECRTSGRVRGSVPSRPCVNRLRQPSRSTLRKADPAPDFGDSKTVTRQIELPRVRYSEQTRLSRRSTNSSQDDSSGRRISNNFGSWRLMTATSNPLFWAKRLQLAIICFLALSTCFRHSRPNTQVELPTEPIVLPARDDAAEYDDSGDTHNFHDDANVVVWRKGNKAAVKFRIVPDRGLSFMCSTILNTFSKTVSCLPRPGPISTACKRPVHGVILEMASSESKYGSTCTVRLMS